MLKRYFNAGEFIDVRRDKALQLLANDVIEVRRCKELNWAILDFAALVCTRRSPLRYVHVKPPLSVQATGVGGDGRSLK